MAYKNVCKMSENMWRTIFCGPTGPTKSAFKYRLVTYLGVIGELFERNGNHDIRWRRRRC